MANLKCTNGKPCGGACIEKTDKCKQNLSQASAQALNSAAFKLTGKSSAKLAKENVPEAIAAATAFAGSTIGGAIAGPLGALAGDIGGQLAARGAMASIEAYRKANAKLGHDEAFANANKLSQAGYIAKGTIAEFSSGKAKLKFEKALIGDIGGFVIGNAVGKAVTSVPMAGVPAAVIAAPGFIIPAANRAHALVRKGAKPSDAAKQAVRETFCLRFKPLCKNN